MRPEARRAMREGEVDLMSGSPESAWLAELISGPYSGYFVGTYAVQSANGYIAYAKLFRERPDDPWVKSAVMKISAFSAESHIFAMASAEAIARECIKDLPARHVVDILLPDEMSAEPA